MYWKRKKNKYRNIKAEIDGIKFDSKKEARRYAELKLLERTGVISDLELQPRFKISKGCIDNTGRKLPPRTYQADFKYSENDVYVVEDVKSPATAKNSLYRLKRQLFLEQYGDMFKFREV